MALGIGILITERISAAAVSEHEIVGSLHQYPNHGEAAPDALRGVPAESIVHSVSKLIDEMGLDEKPSYIGLGMPGIIRNGIVEDSPNLLQFKGSNMQALVTDRLTPKFGRIPVSIFNDADVMAAGLAATQGQLDRLIRVWTLGTGIGYGRYPFSQGVWEAGHIIVTLDPKETFLRVRWQGPSGGHHGAPLDAIALHGPGARRSISAGSRGRLAVRGFRKTLASGAGGWDGDEHSPGWTGQVFRYRLQRAVPEFDAAQRVSARDGQAEPAARIFDRGCSGGRGGRGDRGGGQRTAGGEGRKQRRVVTFPL